MQINNYSVFSVADVFDDALDDIAMSGEMFMLCKVMLCKVKGCENMKSATFQ